MKDTMEDTMEENINDKIKENTKYDLKEKTKGSITRNELKAEHEIKKDTDRNKLHGSRIERSIEGNKLVIECSTVNYKLHMLEFNKIKGLLPLEIREQDGVKELCYDITSYAAFGSLGAARTLRMSDIRNLIYSLHHILTNIDVYLLSPDELILDKDYIYVDAEDLSPRLCYLPGYDSDFVQGLSVLLQDVLGMVDHNDHSAVVTAYSLYQESLKPGYVMDDLIRILNEEHGAKRDDKNRSGINNNGENSEAAGDNTAADAGNDIGNTNQWPVSDTDLSEENNAGWQKPREKTTDELFLAYQMPAMGHHPFMQQTGTGAAGQPAEDHDSMFNAINKINKKKHSSIFGRN